MTNDTLPPPDPALTANLYCSGHLDAAIHQCLGPFWREATASSQNVHLRLLRYGRRGPHIKIRIHGAEDIVAALRPALERAANEFVSSLAPTTTHEPSSDALPPIDLEDEGPLLHPDRTLLFTHHRRNQIELGGPPLLHDNTYAALMALCLSVATEKVLVAIRPDERGDVPFRIRQNTLLKAIVTATACLPRGASERASYLAYHRDWLVRFVLGPSRQDAESGVALVRKLDVGITKLGPARDAYRKMADATWSGVTDGTNHDNWQQAITQLIVFVDRFADCPEYAVDPFAIHPVFPALFKVLHGLANQLGVKPTDEAFAHHLLLVLALPEGAEWYGFQDKLLGMNACR